MKSQIKEVEIDYSSRASNRYYTEVSHQGLNKHRVIKGPTKELVQKKASFQAAEWDDKWEKLSCCINKKDWADTRTKEAQNDLIKLKNILKSAVDSKSRQFEILKDTSSFLEPKPKPSPIPPKPTYEEIPNEPKYIPLNHNKIGFPLNLINPLKNILYKFRDKRELEHQESFKLLYNKWLDNKNRIEKNNSKIKRQYDVYISSNKKQYDDKVIKWKERQHLFYEKQARYNNYLDDIKEKKENLDPNGTEQFFKLVLSNSKYPNYFPIQFQIEYIKNTKTLLVNYLLPSPLEIPTIKEVKYIKSRDEFKEIHLSSYQSSQLFDEICYQVTLRTIKEIFDFDKVNAVSAIVFNGWVNTIDRSKGKEVTPCILSLHVKRSEFEEINLSEIEPRLCFKGLKGVGSSKLQSLAHINPIIQTQKPDRRFTESYNVVDTLDDTYNLATMDWEDFEHLIRELFEKEFTSSGCEVNVTHASRDGGVDAIIFNPDPIHGGKIVIQAKRYTNPVGVSAIRDLYGTVLNEGANKGILVTTSDFGPDSYKFAKEKPLVLFNGGNLLQLMEKHGHKVKIDLQEAKN